MKFRKIIGITHLWLGLTSGLIVFIIGLTGCILVFEEEICTLLDYGVFKQVAPQHKDFAPPSVVFTTADAFLRDKKIARTYYTVSLKEPRVNAMWALDSSRQYHAVLQDPYTGRVISQFDYKNAFFTLITHIHISLGIGETGTLIISYATLIFVVLMITGIILWKPASKKGYKQRFTIKWNAKGKRLNYDLHNVLGFYVSWIAIFIALTGLVWSFEWMNNSVQWLANGGKTILLKKEKITSDTTSAAGRYASLYRVSDSLFNDMVRTDNAKAIRIYKPNNTTDALRFTVETLEGAHYARSDEYFFDQHSGKLLATQKFSEQSNGEKIRRMNYYIHVGSIGGLPGKLLAFFASLITASLPVTGFIIWIGRKRKKQPQSSDRPAKKKTGKSPVRIPGQDHPS